MVMSSLSFCLVQMDLMMQALGDGPHEAVRIQRCFNDFLLEFPQSVTCFNDFPWDFLNL
jgi:hypothetical protein